MPGFNLVRNSRVFFTTDVAASTGIVAQGTLTASKTQELAVMNGFSFSQGVDAQVVTISEGGNTPSRGQRSFNTALQPVDFSFTTYIRPRGGATTDMDEKVLWNALLSDGAVNLVPTGTTTPGEFAASATTIGRTGTANVVTYTWVSLNLSATALTAGTRVHVGGNINTNGLGFNGPGVITSITGGGLATCTGMVITMDAAPLGTGNPTTTVTGIYITANSAALRNPVVTGGSFPEPAHVQITSGLSNKNQMQKFGMVIAIDQATYIIDNAALDSATVEFGLDGIAQIAWTGKGTALRVLAATSFSGATLSGGTAGTVTLSTIPSVGAFITNKLSTAVVKSTFLGLGTSAKTYAVAITGGSLSIANNITYITPEALGIVNQPIGYFTGTRSVTGSVTAYLKTGAGNTTNTLLNDLLAAPTEVKYYLELHVGGQSNANKVEFEFPGVTLQVPTVDVQDVVSTTISFTAQGTSLPSSLAADLDAVTSFYDVEAANDMLVRYYAA